MAETPTNPETVVPICMYCRRIRSRGGWYAVSTRALERVANLSHGMCEDCYKGIVESELAAIGSMV